MIHNICVAVGAFLVSLPVPHILNFIIVLSVLNRSHIGLFPQLIQTKSQPYIYIYGINKERK